MKLYFRTATSYKMQSEYIAIDVNNHCFTENIVAPFNVYMELNKGDFEKLKIKLIGAGYALNWYM